MWWPVPACVRVSLSVPASADFGGHETIHARWLRQPCGECSQQRTTFQTALARYPLPPLALRAPETFMHNLRALFLFCPQDLLKDHHAERSTLGIHLSLPSQVPPGVRPGQIRDLALGGPAYLSGQVELGDEIVAVDGVPVSDADSVSALVRGSDEIGTTCVVTLLRDTETFDAVLIRGSSTRVRAIQKIFQLIDITDAHIKNGNLDGAIQALSLLHGNLWASESSRMEKESRLSERLAKMQSTLFNDITAAEKALHPMPHSEEPEVVINPAAKRAQRSAAPPPPPQPAYDEAELKILRKQVGELSTKISKLADMNELLTEEKEGLSAQIRTLTLEMQRVKDDDIAKIADLKRELAKALEERDAAASRVAEFESQLQAVKQDCEVLTATNENSLRANKSLSQKVADRQQAVDTAELKMQTEMVLRSHFTRLQTEFRVLETKYEEVAAEMHPLKARLTEQADELAVLRADASKWKQAAKNAQDELIDLHQLLDTAGLGKRTDIVTLGELLAGKVSWQRLYITDVFDFLSFLNEPPKRTLEEAKNILKVMNLEQPWTAEYLLQVRNLFRGPPELTVERVKDMIDNQGSSAKLSAERDTLKKKIDELKEQRARLQQELEGLRSENTFQKQLTEKLQTETLSLQGRVRELGRLNSEQDEQISLLKRDDTAKDALVLSLRKRLEEVEGLLAEERRKEASLERKLLRTKAELEEDEKNLEADKKIFATNNAAVAALNQKVRDLEAALAVSRSKECPNPKAHEANHAEEIEPITMNRSRGNRAQRSAPPPRPPATEEEEHTPIMMVKSEASRMQRSAAPPPPPAGMEEDETSLLSQSEQSRLHWLAAPAPPPPVPMPPSPVGECGIGLLLEKKSGEGGVHVKDVVPGGPADRCGRIRPGDEVLAVDGKSSAGVPLEQIFDMIIGQVGSQVTIDVAQGQTAVAKLTLTRAFPISAEQLHSARSQYSSRGATPVQPEEFRSNTPVHHRFETPSGTKSRTGL